MSRYRHSRTNSAWLFVPGDRADLIKKAVRTSADVVILDLEDAVADENRSIARSVVRGHLEPGGQSGQFCVRVNNSSDLALDLDAVIHAATSSVMLPKSESAEELRELDERITHLEAKRGMQPGSVGVVPLVETPQGVLTASAIATGPRVVALAFGTEDYAAAMRVSPSPELYAHPLAQISLSAAASDVGALGVGASLRQFSDEVGFEKAVSSALAVGMTGCLCIHPRQISAAQRAFATAARDQKWALSVVEGWRSRSNGVGVITVNGEMVDRPVAELAERILASRAHN